MVRVNVTAKRFLRVFLAIFVLFNVVIPLSFASAQSAGVNNILETASQENYFWKSFSKNLYQASPCLPTDGNLVIISGETCSLSAGTYSYDSVMIEAGGTLIASGDPVTGSGVIITTSTMDNNGTISADGQGYPAASGPGAGANGGGAGHGGVGGNSSNGGIGGNGYGDIYAPIELGSGGGSGNVAGGAGGGAIKLVVSGELVNNGIISANGNTANPGGFGTSNGGGGSGGSIYIQTSSLTGSGTIRANGGNGVSSAYGSYGGGGAGGHIAVDVPVIENDFSGAVTTFGGVGNQIAGAGIVYWGQPNELVVDNNLQSGNKAILLTGTYDFNSIVIKGKGTLRILGETSNITLENNTLKGDGTGRLEVEGTIHAPAAFSTGNVMLAVLNGLTGPTSITTKNNGGVELYASTKPSGVFEYESVTVEANSTLLLVSYNNSNPNYTDDYGLTLLVNELTVQTGGTISADGQGYPAASGPGAGANGGGAGHGGVGGNSSNGGIGGNGYGDIYAPIELGSGGGSGNVAGGAGGGAIKLVVSGELVNNGIISANGNTANPGGFGTSNGGGGSGGSIYIQTSSLTGSGTIRANGGNGVSSAYGSYGGGGAGGHIAVFSNNSSTIQFSYLGGSGHISGGIGSLYFGSLDPSESTFTLDKPSAIADNTDSVTASITLKNADGVPLPNQSVEIAVASGEGLRIGNTYAVVDEYVPIGVTNVNGVVTASLKTIKAGERTFKVRVGQILLDSPGTVTFIPGAVDPTMSLVYVPVNTAPANGQTPITVVVTVLDKNNNPIPNADVVITTDSNTTTITQPDLTDPQGKATGTIVNTVSEVVNISASVDGVSLADTEGVVFRGADMSLHMSGMPILTAGADVQYYVVVTNENGLLLQNVNFQVILPSSVTYINNSLSVSPTQTGSTLTWDLGNLAFGEKVAFSIMGQASSALNVGDILTVQANASTDTTEESSANNLAVVNSEVVDGHNYDTSIEPPSATVSSDVQAEYSILVENKGLLADEFEVSVSGLDPTWFTLSAATLNLGPGEREYVKLDIQASGCVIGSFPFNVTVASSQTNTVESAQVNFQNSPILSEIYPANGVVIGSTNVVFSWRSDTETTGELTIYPAGEPQNAVAYPSNNASTMHSILVSGLKTATTYEWYVHDGYECGDITTSPQQFTIEKGVVFSSHQLTHAIDRDYEQIRVVSIKNIDLIPRTVGLEIEDVYDDLIVNFRGSGSFEEEITLLPGETREIEIVYFAQDAVEESYDITAKLTSTSGEQTVTDFAVIHTNIQFEANYIVEEIGLHPTLHIMQYRVTNLGSPITDLNISAVDTVTGLPAPVILKPQIYHARLGRGESITFMAFPQYSPNQLSGIDLFASTFGILASPVEYQSSDTLFDILAVADGARKTVRHPSAFHCSKQLFYVTYDEAVAYTTPISSWYCPNDPYVLIQFLLDDFFNTLDIFGGMLHLIFNPSSASTNHSTSVSLNGVPLGSLDNTVPDGDYSFLFGEDAINQGIGANISQLLEIITQWPYGNQDDPHYINGVGGEVTVAARGLTVIVCADSAEEARAIADEFFGIHELPTSLHLQIEAPNPGFTVSPDANGFINVKAFVGDDRDVYHNDYTVKAEITYLDQANHPTDTFFLFDDGGAGHKDLHKDDRYFNALWSPRFGGQVKLKVTATAVHGLTDTAERTFFVDARPDFEVKRVFIEKITRDGELVEVKAEITNNGFSITGPVTVKFNYYNTDDDGNKIGVPVWTSEQELFGTFLDNVFDHGQTTTIRDNTFIAPDVDIYYVEVIVDPY